MCAEIGVDDADTYSVVIKVDTLGDSQIGKTIQMVKYVEGHFEEDYIQTLGELGYVCAACASGVVIADEVSPPGSM